MNLRNVKQAIHSLWNYCNMEDDPNVVNVPAPVNPVEVFRAFTSEGITPTNSELLTLMTAMYMDNRFDILHRNPTGAVVMPADDPNQTAQKTRVAEALVEKYRQTIDQDALKNAELVDKYHRAIVDLDNVYVRVFTEPDSIVARQQLTKAWIVLCQKIREFEPEFYQSHLANHHQNQN